MINTNTNKSNETGNKVITATLEPDKNITTKSLSDIKKELAAKIQTENLKALKDIINSLNLSSNDPMTLAEIVTFTSKKLINKNPEITKYITKNIIIAHRVNSKNKLADPDVFKSAWKIISSNVPTAIWVKFVDKNPEVKQNVIKNSPASFKKYENHNRKIALAESKRIKKQKALANSKHSKKIAEPKIIKTKQNPKLDNTVVNVIKPTVNIIKKDVKETILSNDKVSKVTTTVKKPKKALFAKQPNVKETKANVSKQPNVKETKDRTNTKRIIKTTKKSLVNDVKKSHKNIVVEQTDLNTNTLNNMYNIFSDAFGKVTLKRVNAMIIGYKQSQLNVSTHFINSKSESLLEKALFQFKLKLIKIFNSNNVIVEWKAPVAKANTIAMEFINNFFQVLPVILYEENICAVGFVALNCLKLSVELLMNNKPLNLDQPYSYSDAINDFCEDKSFKEYTKPYLNIYKTFFPKARNNFATAVNDYRNNVCHFQKSALSITDNIIILALALINYQSFLKNFNIEFHQEINKFKYNVDIMFTKK